MKYLLSILLALNIFALDIPKIQKDLKEGKGVGIDLRTIVEIKMNAAPGATHLSYFDLKGSEDKLDKTKKLYLFCESGGRSKKAFDHLKAQGFKNIVDIKDWRTWNKIYSGIKK